MDILSNHRRFVGHFRIEIKEEGTALSSSVVAAAIGRSYTTKSINAFMYLFTDCILITTQSTSKKDAKPYKFLRRLLFKHLTILNKKMDPNTGDILPLLDDLATLASTTTVSESNVTSPTSSSPPLLLRFSYTEPKAEMICVVMAEEKQLNAVCSCVFSYNSGSSSKGSLSSQEEIRRT